MRDYGAVGLESYARCLSDTAGRGRIIQETMKKYSVMLRGENFEINIEGKVDNLGFYTTRIVKANSPEEAEQKAVELIKNDDNLIQIIQPNSQETPMIYLESMSEVPWWRRVGGSGYSFWPMEGE